MYDLHHLCPAIRKFCEDLDLKIIRPLNRLSGGVAFEYLSGDAAFEIDEDEKRMLLNLNAIEMIFANILELDSLANYTETVALSERLVELYVLHELIHVSQNLYRFSDVQALKRLASHDRLGELDLLADHDAARFVAAVMMARSQASGRNGFLNHLLTSLVAMNTVAPTTFGAPPDKPHKQRRFLGSAISTAFLDEAGCDFAAFEQQFFPLDTPIYPYFGRQSGEVLLFDARGGGLVVEPFQVKARVVEELHDLVAVAHFPKVLAKARLIVRRVMQGELTSLRRSASTA
ncbi:hypothetical protein ACTZWW_13045 [Salinarimonas sp. NSM]|uniref:hypothetical protein n=1 Tax=Salinarimonas sp. NSM TaxID=3458003 RepID=UPI004036FAA3